jgi:hypothetical protein
VAIRREPDVLAAARAAQIGLHGAKNSAKEQCLCDNSVIEREIEMQEEDLQALRTAVAALEHPGLAARLAEIAGKPIELVSRALPETASKAVATATTKALDAALSVALRTMKNEPKAASSLLHKALAATSGAVGGSFGLAALPIELPISTIIMLRPLAMLPEARGKT